MSNFSSIKGSSAWQELLQKLNDGLNILPDKPEESAESTLAALWLKAQGVLVSVTKTEKHTLNNLSSEQTAELHADIARRLSGEPLAHITGRQDFMGLDFLVGPEALVPRRETELLARAGIAKANEMLTDSSSLTIIDVCTGSGNVALAVAEYLKRENANFKLFAADLSVDAVGLAQTNAKHLKLDDVVEFRAGDLLAPFDLSEFANKVDVLTCNPPYINQAKVELMPKEISAFEPRLAFDGGPFGVSILMRLIETAPLYLKEGGWLAFEVGLGQGRPVTKQLERSGAFTEIQTICDEADQVRTICARKR